MLTGSSNSAINQVSLCCIFVPREFYGMEGKSDCSPKFWISDNPEVLAAQPFAYRQGISNAQDSKEIACVHGPSPWRHHSHLSRDSHHNAASDLTPKLLKARSGPWRIISSRNWKSQPAQGTACVGELAEPTSQWDPWRERYYELSTCFGTRPSCGCRGQRCSRSFPHSTMDTWAPENTQIAMAFIWDRLDYICSKYSYRTKINKHREGKIALTFCIPCHLVFALGHIAADICPNISNW